MKCFRQIFVVSLFILSLLIVSETQADIRGQIDSYLNTPIHVRERLKVVFDGTEASAGILKSTQFVNELVFKSASEWRARRDIPFTEQSIEFMQNNQGLRILSPYGRSSESPFVVSETSYLQILASPLQWAQEWKMSGADSSLESLLKNLEKEPLKGTDESLMSLEKLQDGTTVLKGTGWLSIDSKTRARVEWTWQILEMGKLKDNLLENSLVRSL